MVKLDTLVSKKAAKNLRAGNLHKIAAIIEKNRGNVYFDTIDLASAAYLIGQRAYIKNSSFNKIVEGLNSLKEVKE